MDQKPVTKQSLAIPKEALQKMSDSEIATLVLGENEKEDPRNGYLETLGFFFYLYELYRFSTTEHLFSMYGFGTSIFLLQSIVLFLALPILYLVRFANFVEWGDALLSFLASYFKFENLKSYNQINLFYKATNTLLVTLIALELIRATFF